MKQIDLDIKTLLDQLMGEQTAEMSDEEYSKYAELLSRFRSEGKSIEEMKKLIQSLQND